MKGPGELEQALVTLRGHNTVVPLKDCAYCPSALDVVERIARTALKDLATEREQHEELKRRHQELHTRVNQLTAELRCCR